MRFISGSSGRATPTNFNNIDLQPKTHIFIDVVHAGGRRDPPLQIPNKRDIYVSLAVHHKSLNATKPCFCDKNVV